MPKEAQSAPDVLVALKTLGVFFEHHQQAWKNAVAANLNRLVDDALDDIKNIDEPATVEHGAAVYRIVKRVAEFETIERIPRE